MSEMPMRYHQAYTAARIQCVIRSELATRYNTMTDHLKIVSMIFEGANVNTKTSLGRTPLHVAAAQGRGSIVDILLNNGK